MNFKKEIFVDATKKNEILDYSSIGTMRSVAVVASGSFALGLDAYIVAGLLPSIANNLHVSLSLTGLLITFFMLCYALVSPIFVAALSEQRTNLILTIALIVFSAANYLSAFSGSSFTLLICSRMLAGIGAGIYAPFASSTAASLVPSNLKGRAISIVMGGMIAGTILGVPTGLIIATYFGWQSSFLFVALIGSIILVVQFFWLPDLKSITTPSLKVRIQLLKRRRLLSIIVVSTLCAIAGLGLYTYLPSILMTIGLKHFAITYYLLAWGIGGVVGAFLSGKLIDHFGHPFRIVTGILVLIMLTMVILPLSINFQIVAIITLALWGAGGWGLQIPQQHQLLGVTPNDGVVALSLNGSARYLGAALGSAGASTLLLFGVKLQTLPFIASAIILFALVIHLIFNGSHFVANNLSQ